ncbi:MAG: hypothetical protein ACSHYA_00525 [Opitutaceae bacterium]
MGTNNVTVCSLISLLAAFAISSNVVSAASDSERIAQLEARLLLLEKRLAETEQKLEVADAPAPAPVASVTRNNILDNKTTLDMLASSTWRNLRWTQEEQWDGIVAGMSEEQVIELLGDPPRSVKSMKPRVDMVYWYETSLRDRSNSMRGKVSFKKGKVIAVQKPIF